MGAFNIGEREQVGLRRFQANVYSLMVHMSAAPLAGALAVALAALATFLDLISPITLNVSIVYSIPLILAAVARRRRLLWILLLFLLCINFAVYVALAGPGGLSVSEPPFLNRLLSSVAMLLTAGLLHLWTRTIDTLQERDRVLKDQNDRLDGAYRELAAYQEQIKQQNEQLDRRRRDAEEASRRKTILLASMSHDIRTPLTAITLMAQAIGRTAEDPASAAESPALARGLQTSAISVANLISDILNFSTFELGRVELHLSEFDLDDLIREQCRNLIPLARAKQLTLATELMVSPVRMHADQAKLARVLSNLVANAIKYIDKGFVRVIADRTTDGGVWVRVQDSGIGIVAEDLERIFDEFAQLHRPESDRSQGWGLGLSICRRLVALMGGTIRVESSYGKGSAFTVILPPSCILESLSADDARTASDGYCAGGGAASLVVRMEQSARGIAPV